MEFSAWSFIWQGLAFYGFMSWFAAVEAQIVIYAVFSFSKSKTASSQGFPFALSGIDFRI
jgi:hypothetical protein